MNQVSRQPGSALLFGFASSPFSGYGDRMTVEAIKDLEEEAWDCEIERDFAPGGRGERLIAEAEADIAAGRTRPLADVLAEAKARREQSRT